MRTIPLEEYRKKIRLQGAREEGFEEGMEKGLKIAERLEKTIEKVIEKGIEIGIAKVARSMLEDGMPLQEVAKYTRLPVGELQQLQPQ